MIFIIGASGLIGGNILNYLKKKGYKVSGTYFKTKKKGLHYFDIAKHDIKKLKIKKKINHLIIASAINVNLDDTKKNFKNSYFINVTKTKKIIDHCFKNNIIPIYLSSDGVFDGKKGHYIETDKKNPLHSYGKNKDEVEKYILKKQGKHIIIRVSRVFSDNKNDKNFITLMKKNLYSRNKILCPDDQFFSPIFTTDLSRYLEKLIKDNHTGIFHLTSIKSITHYEVAQTVKTFFKIKSVKILPCKINSFQLIEKRPLLTNLLMYKFEKLFNVKYQNLKYYLKKIK